MPTVKLQDKIIGIVPNQNLTNIYIITYFTGTVGSCDSSFIILY